MNGIQFYETVMGRRFYEGTMPKLIKSIDRIADRLEMEDCARRYSRLILDPEVNAEKDIQAELDKGAVVENMCMLNGSLLIVYRTNRETAKRDAVSEANVP